MAVTKLAVQGGDPVRTRPFPSWPVFDATEEAALLRVLHSGKWWAGAYPSAAVAADDPVEGPASENTLLGQEFARAQDCRYGLPATNGTTTLAIIMRALGIGPGDEVIVPPYTFISSASTILELGATPIFADIDPETYNLDPACAEAAITPRTRAIMVVHFAGQAVDLDAFIPLAQKHGLALIEDAAHAHGAAWRERGCGSFGAAGSFSFQATKNMTSGEGGLITTNDPELAQACHSILWCGRLPGRPWYEHHRLGGNFRLTEFQAALLRAQLARLAEQTARRDAHGRWLADQLKTIPGVTPMQLDPRATRISFHVFAFHYDAAAFRGMARADLVAALDAEGIPCSTGYCYPLYRNPMFLEWQFPYGSERFSYADFAARCPACETACADSVWFPQRVLLGDQADLGDVVAAVAKIQRLA